MVSKMGKSLSQKSPLPPGESWGEGKRSWESIEKTGSDSAIRTTLTPGPSPAERERGGWGIGSKSLAPNAFWRMRLRTRK